jgi:hypothetical protein
MLTGAVKRPVGRDRTMRKKATATRYPGVLKIGKEVFRIRFKFVEPKTGRQREVDEVDREVRASDAREASRQRDELLVSLRRDVSDGTSRERVLEFAKSWIESKAHVLDERVAEHHGDILELHVLPAFGDYFLDALERQDVRDWSNRSLGWTQW